MLAMSDAASYTTVEYLRDGRAITIRALTPCDRDELLAAVERSSVQSRYQRFFAVKSRFSEHEVDYFLKVDFTSQVALVAVLTGESRTLIVGGGRYVVLRPGAAEVAFAVVDEYQGQRIGSLLLRHLAAIARAAGIGEFVADVLATNRPMLKVFEKSGYPMSTTRDSSVVHVSVRIDEPPERARKPYSIATRSTRGRRRLWRSKRSDTRPALPRPRKAPLRRPSGSAAVMQRTPSAPALRCPTN